MLTRIDLRGDRSDPSDRLPRASEAAVEDTRAIVRDVVDAVRAQGDAAVAQYTAKFDGYDGAQGLDVPLAQAEQALAGLDPDLRAALERGIEQVRWFHDRARPVDWMEQRGGARMGVRHSPLKRVGVYVPGGLGAYPSTVIMTCVPAKVAGVDEIILCTPPGADGAINPAILAAAALIGVDRILRIGGAQAVAAMAYGTATVPRCDKIVGPGNRFVAEAKQQVAADGVCGIDAMAGVTEVAIIADATADPLVVAADLVAQSEHDPLVTALLITDSPELLEQVEVALASEVAATRHRQRVETALRGQGAVALVDDIDHAIEVADAFAAEHLEIQTADSSAVADRIRAAGAIFVGGPTPVSVGDYCAGPNHTLPTAGTARFTGGLRTDDFFVSINVVEFTQDELAEQAPMIAAFGAAEDLPAHVRAVDVRLQDRG